MFPVTIIVSLCTILVNNIFILRLCASMVSVSEYIFHRNEEKTPAPKNIHNTTQQKIEQHSIKIVNYLRFLRSNAQMLRNTVFCARCST